MYFHVSCEDGDLFEENGSPLPCIDTHINASNNKNIKKLFADVVNAKLSGEQRKANLCFELLLCELTSQKMCLKEIEVAQKIQSMIHGYPEHFFGNEELARIMNVSVKTAETKFKAAFGKTIHQYILEFKIKEAMSYFDRFEEISVKEVAYNLGFCDEYHFSKQFAKYVGMSPSKYKKLKNHL
jgi:AraC-like DNA-binding protein